MSDIKRSRKEIFADIAHERAEFFAHGGGVGSKKEDSLLTPIFDLGSKAFFQEIDAATGDLEKQHQTYAKPSPTFEKSVLLHKIYASLDKKVQEVVEKYVLPSCPSQRGVYLCNYAPEWTPFSVGQDSKSAKKIVKQDESPPSVQHIQASLEPRRTRMPIAVAGPSGVRLDVPSLAQLALEVIIQNMDQVREFAPVQGFVRKSFSSSLCRARALDGHAFSVLTLAAAKGDGYLSLPDCAGVDEDAFASVLLEACESGLKGFDLGHVGACFTNQAVKRFVAYVSQSQVQTGGEMASSSLPVSKDDKKNAFCQLKLVHLNGPYALSESHLCHFLQMLPNLESFRLENSPLVTGKFLETLQSYSPNLKDLWLCKLPNMKEERISTKSGETFDYGPAKSNAGSKRGFQDSTLLSLASLAKATELHSISLGYIPSLTDASLSPLLEAIGSKLSRVQLEACEGVTDESMYALAQLESLEHLEHLALITMDNMTARGLDAVTRMLEIRPESAPKLRSLRLMRLKNMLPSAVLAFLLVLPPNTLRYVSFAGTPAINDAVITALAKRHAESLLFLDISMCNYVSDTAIGGLVDAAINLKKLAVWGCAQLSRSFFDGHIRAVRDTHSTAGDNDAARNDEEEYSHLRIYGRAGDFMPEHVFEPSREMELMDIDQFPIAR